MSEEKRKCFVAPDYFREGDYTQWYYEAMTHINDDLTYEEWLEKVLIPEMEEYDALVLYEDGTLYGIKDNIVYDISYNEFDPDDEWGKIFFKDMLKKYAYLNN